MQKAQKTDPRLIGINTRINKCNKKIKGFKYEISETVKIDHEVKALRDEIVQTEASYKKANMTPLLGQNLSYKQKKKSYQEADEKLRLLNIKNIPHKLKTEERKLQNLNKDFEEIQEIIRTENLKKSHPPTVRIKEESSKTQKNFSKQISFTIKPEWKNINFFDGHIIISHESKYYKKYLNQSKKYLNYIKSYYSFKNVPKLEVVISNNEIYEIKNAEVLFFHLEFLSASGNLFGFVESIPMEVARWNKFTKAYYKTHLSFLFHTKSLKKLCSVCDEMYPIIPVAEAVINSDGSKVIHNSFLFPIKTKMGYKIIWESVEESKASYIFSNLPLQSEALQNLYNYIVGDTTNKRETLIHSTKLRHDLKMIDRLLHTSFEVWERQINMLTKQ